MSSDGLRTQKGLHILEMPEFLRKEAITGQLRGILPPDKRTDLWGRELWDYLIKWAVLTSLPLRINSSTTGWPT